MSMQFENVVDIPNPLTGGLTRFHVHEANTDVAIKAKLIEMGWTPPKPAGLVRDDLAALCPDVFTPGNYPVLEGFQRSAEARKRAAQTRPAFKLNAEGSVAVSTEVYWNEDMRQCPRGSKCQLLGAGGVAVYGNYDGAPFWVGWAPLPKRRAAT